MENGKYIYIVFRIDGEDEAGNSGGIVGVCHTEEAAREVVKEDGATDDQMMFLQGCGATGTPNDERERWEIWACPANECITEWEIMHPEYSYPERHGGISPDYCDEVE